MLSAALRGPPAPAAGPSSIGLVGTLPRPVLRPQAEQTKQPLGSSINSLKEEDCIFCDSPRAQPAVMRNGQHVDSDDEDAPEGHDEVFCMEQPCMEPDSSASSQTTPMLSAFHSYNTPSSHPALSAAVEPSPDFAIGRAALAGSRGSSHLELSELEHHTHGAARGSRPIVIPRRDLMSSTYHPTAGAFMPAFVPPHELAAASLHGTEPMVHSHRHKSTADRLRTAVFEQTGFMSVTTAAAFLHSGAPPQRNKP